jgi:hypothetical protein
LGPSARGTTISLLVSATASLLGAIVTVTILVRAAFVENAHSLCVLLVVRSGHSIFHGEVGVSSGIKSSLFRVVLSIFEALHLSVALISNSRGHVHQLVEDSETQLLLGIRLLEGRATDPDVRVGDFLLGSVTPCFCGDEGQDIFVLETTSTGRSSARSAAHEFPESLLVEHHVHGSLVPVLDIGVIVSS